MFSLFSQLTTLLHSWLLWVTGPCVYCKKLRPEDDFEHKAKLMRIVRQMHVPPCA